jgi:hypothetical protein
MDRQGGSPAPCEPVFVRSLKRSPQRKRCIPCRFSMVGKGGRAAEGERGQEGWDTHCQPSGTLLVRAPGSGWRRGSLRPYLTPLRKQCHRISSHRFPRARRAAWSLASSPLGVGRTRAPKPIAEASRRPLLHGVGQVSVAGQAAGHLQLTLAGAAGDRGLAPVALQRVHDELLRSLAVLRIVHRVRGGLKAEAAPGRHHRPGTQRRRCRRPAAPHRRCRW